MSLSETEDGAKELHLAVTPKQVLLGRTSRFKCFGARTVPLEYLSGGAY